MNRHLQEPGIRRWIGEDLIELQSESLCVLDNFFAQYGSCIIKGCEVSGSGISEGLVALAGVDENSDAIFKVARFAGAQNITNFPVYLTLSKTAINRLYEDQLIKPVVYQYYAELHSAMPTVPHIVIDTDGGRSFIDAIQDDEHSMISQSERSAWNAKETPTGAQNKANTALDNAKTYANVIVAAKLNRDGSNISSGATFGANLNAVGIRTVVSCISNGTYTYRKWSDGFVEYFGLHTLWGTSGTLYLPITFSTDRYYVITHGITTIRHLKAYRSASSFKWYQSNVSSGTDVNETNDYFIYCAGYIVEFN